MLRVPAHFPALLMLDAFAYFELSPQPWLDAAALKEQFHRRSAAQHPDTGGAAGEFAELQAAYQTLRDPATRLRHLLELTSSADALPAPSAIPAELADLFLQTASARQAAEQFLAKYRAASTPLMRALLAEEVAEKCAQLDGALHTLAATHAAAEERLARVSRSWREHRAEVAALAAEFSYLAKWSSQLRETRLQLEIAAG